MIDFTIENKDHNKIYLNLIKFLFIFKLLISYIERLKYVNEFEETNKINLFTLNLFFKF